MINLFLSLTKSMSLRIIWMLFLIPSCVISANELYRRCSQPFNCGDQSGLLYPFWIPGREECGHPEFKLECHNRSAEVSFSSVKFRLLDANYISHKIRLARSDFLNNMCPQSPLNVSFMDNVLPFAPNTDVLTIYYGCKFSREVYTFGGVIGCPDDKNIEHGRNYFVTRNLSSPLLQEISSSLNEFRRLCERNVSVPASGPSLNRLQTSPNVENLGKALRDGFELGLNQECLMCIGSKGACGYNQTSSGFICYCADESQKGTCSSRKKGISYGIAAKIGSGVGVSLFLILILALFHQIHRKRKTPHDLDQQNLTLLSQPKLKSLIPLKEYSYAQVKRITKSFAEEVGKGGFGTVYKGTLSDGRMVAVKVLNESKGNNSEDFINEVASMSQTSHVNIVTLLGFCSEGSKRAIIYEFLENGSLDKFISLRTSMDRDWKELSRIALGVARGLEYLHHGCKTRIVHFDIKPQNVLLDDNFVPKVSDFGLAKLCEKKESILSLLDTRGTIGYIAPELFSRMYGRVSHKSDVYSYGMLVLEMIGARNEERGAHNSASNTSSMYFPEWIYKDIEKGDTRKLVENGIGIEENELAKKMSMVGLWCIQSSPADRPPMNRVVEMMEGNLDALEVPPRPAFEIPSGPFPESSTLFSRIHRIHRIKKKTSLNHHESCKYILST